MAKKFRKVVNNTSTFGLFDLFMTLYLTVFVVGVALWIFPYNFFGGVFVGGITSLWIFFMLKIWVKFFSCRKVYWEEIK